MASTIQPGPAFRLLDLPPELRVPIYEHVFADEAPVQIDVLKAESYRPPLAITTVNRHVRKESIDLFRKAKQDFLRTHELCVFIHQDTNDEASEKALLGRFEQELNFPISSVTFHIQLNIPQHDARWPPQNPAVGIVKVQAVGTPAVHCEIIQKPWPCNDYKPFNDGDGGSFQVNWPASLAGFRRTEEWQLLKGSVALDVAACTESICRLLFHQYDLRGPRGPNELCCFWHGW